MESSKNSRVYEYVERVVDKNAVPHALLISGADDEKEKIANLLARAILCTGERKPCGACNSCRKAEAMIHPDLLVFETEKTMIQVDEIRDIRKDAFIFPNDGEKKVYIIKAADKMNPQAQNAFLKILEEPPKFTTFILLCTNHNSFLTTILSRVTHLRLQEQEDYSEVSDETKELAGLVAESIAKRDELEILSTFMQCEKRKRDEMLEFYSYLRAVLRDSMVQDALPNDLLINDKAAKAVATALNVREIFKTMEITENARRLTTQNVGVGHILAMVAAEIACALK